MIISVPKAFFIKIQSLSDRIRNSGEKTKILLSIIALLAIAGTVFFALRFFTSSQQVFASTSVVSIELPSGIKSKDLNNLTKEQKNKLDGKIGTTISKKKEKIALQGFVIPQVIVLTENKQPIIIENQTRSDPVSTPTPAPETPFPSPLQCSDTDNNVNYSLKGVCNSPNITETDLCISNQLLREWGCNEVIYNENGVSKTHTVCQSANYQCPKGCRNGACVDEEIPPSSQCNDTDNGVNYSLIGTCNSFGADDETDSCISTQLLREWGCNETTYTEGGVTKTHTVCQSDNYQCPNGCRDGVCLETGNLLNKINFTYSQEAKDAYYQENETSLEDDVNRIYQKAKEIFGLPFKGNPVSIEVSNDGGYYNITLNKIVFGRNNPPSRLQLIWLILSAFHDDLASYMPENWENGMIEVSVYEIARALFDPNLNYLASQTSTYEILNNPAVANKNGATDRGEVTGILNINNLAVAAWYKPYLEDNSFFVNLNKAIYQQAINNTLKDRLIDLAYSIKTAIEGINTKQWFASQNILRFDAIPGKWIVLVVQKAANETSQVLANLQALEIYDNGNKHGVNGRPVNVTAFDSQDNQVWSYATQTAQANIDSGMANLTSLPTISGYTGCVRFVIDVSGFGSTTYYYPYSNGQAMAANDASPKGIYGCVDQKDGKIQTKISSGDQTMDIINGSFSFPSLKNYKGPINLIFTPVAGGQITSKTVDKVYADYYTFIKTGAPPAFRGNAHEATPSSEATKEGCNSGNWVDYVNEKFGYKMKFPRDWGQDPSYSGQSSTFTKESLSSSQNPADLADPTKKVSHIDVLVSAKDLKTDEDYGRWFDDGSGNQKKSTVTFKGIQTEKFVNDTPMPAGNYHSEMYYFKKGDFYYLLTIGIYVTSDVKDKNEQILNCFLENFELKSTQTSNELLQCPQGMYGVKSEKQCQDPPFNQPVCGHTRSIYDQGQRQDGTQEFANVCAYCGFFDREGKQELRGTKMYALGYTEGRCQK